MWLFAHPPQWISKTGTSDRGISKRRKCVGFWNPAGSGQTAWGLKEYREFGLLWGEVRGESKSYRDTEHPLASEGSRL